MGKKRRLKSAKAKFKIKHANHPRLQYLNTQEQEEETIEKTAAKAEFIPEVVLQEKKVEEKPKVTPKSKTTKKPRRSPRKKTTKKTESRAP